MTIDVLERDMIAARKSGDRALVTALSNMIDAVKKASMTPKGRVDITEKLVDETLIKYQKIVQEQYDSCPCQPEYESRKRQYLQELETAKKYAPQLLTDYDAIKEAVTKILADASVELTRSNRGVIMKAVAPAMKGKADMSVVNKVVSELLS